MLGLGINTVTDTGWAASSLLNVLAGNFQARVSADGGEVENMVCLNKDLIDLTTGSDSLLIDRYASPAAAYSLRKLRRDYLGPAIRVRRDDDDQEQDIFFNSDGSLDTASLEAFCAGTDGYVDTWYDQANGNDATQDGNDNQPKIVSSGSIIEENGKPALDFDGEINERLITSSLVYTTNTVFVFAVCSIQSQGIIISQNSIGVGRSGIIEIDSTLKTKYFFNNGTSYNNFSAETLTTGTQYLLTNYSVGDNYYNVVNGGVPNNDISGQSYTPAADGASIGANYPGHNPLNGRIQEIVVYNSDQSSNRTNIETNINNYYKIY
jgi:hypothetical protein